MKNKLVYLVLLLAMVSAAVQVSVGTDKNIYTQGDNATISGYVTSTSNVPQTSFLVRVIVTDPSSSQVTGSPFTDTTDSSGQFSVSDISLASTGTYSVTVQPLTDTAGGAATVFTVEDAEKQILVFTDKFSYTPGETVNITTKVENVLATGNTPASSYNVPIKVKKEDGTVVKETTLTTGSDGTATTSYTLLSNSSAYSKYIVSAKEGAAIAMFDVPKFNVKLKTVDNSNSEKKTYGTTNYVKAKVAVSLPGSEAGSSMPVSEATITGVIKKSDGTISYTYQNFTEDSDAPGTYYSNGKILTGYNTGSYTLETTVTKSGLSQTTKKTFNVKSLKTEGTTIPYKKGFFGLIKGAQAKIGFNVFDLSNDKNLVANQITFAEITACKKLSGTGGSCDSALSSTSVTLNEGDEVWARKMNFTTPNTLGEVELTFNIVTSSGNATAKFPLSLQKVVGKASPRDRHEMPQWEFGTGQEINFLAKAYKTDWSTQATVSAIEITGIFDENGNDVLSNTIETVADRNVSANNISFYAPTTPGVYFVDMELTSGSDIIKTTADFKVRRYDIRVDLFNEEGNWEWRFGSNNTITFKFNVMDLAGNTQGASNFFFTFDSLKNELTQKTYNGLSTTSLSADNLGRKGMNLTLQGAGLDAGFYQAQFTMTDIDGNEDNFQAFFKIANFDSWTESKTNQGEYKWQFGPTENVTFDVHVNDFNWQELNGVVVNITDLKIMKEGPPVSIPSTKYDTSVGGVTAGVGTATVSLKAASGETFETGFYNAVIQLNNSGTIDYAEGWFQVSLMDVLGFANPSTVGSTENASLFVSVSDLNSAPLNGTTVTLHDLVDAQSWSSAGFDVSTVAPVTTNVNGEATIEFPVSSLKNGEYSAILEVTNDDLGASTETEIWFRVQDYIVNSWPVDQSTSTYAPSAQKDYYVQVYYPNYTAVPGANVEVYQFASTQNYPWAYTDATTIGTAQTESSGKATVTFTAPSKTGYYRPLIQVNDSGNIVNITDPWSSTEFEVRTNEVTLTLFDNTTGNESEVFSPNSMIKAQINISNPSGGSVSISELNLVKYKNVDTQSETTLGTTITSNIDESNELFFTAPTSEGEYVLTVSVKDSSSGKYTYKKAFFKVKNFDVFVSTNQWNYDVSEDNVTLNIEAYDSAGVQTNVNVSLLRVTDIWSNENAEITSSDGNKTIGLGDTTYNFSVPANDGEYDAVLCIYTGNECNESIDLVWYTPFSVTSGVDVWTWPSNPSFTSDENVTINVEVFSGNLEAPNQYSTEVLGLYTPSDTLVTDYDTPTTTENGAQNREEVSFSHNLTEGDYKMMLNVTYGSKSYTRQAWFRVSSFSIMIEPSDADTWEFSSSQNITMNVTLLPAQNTTVNVEVMDSWNWQTVSNQNYTVDLTDGFGQVNISGLSSGDYMARAYVDGAESLFWFQVKSFKTYWKWGPGKSIDRVGPTDNVTVCVYVENPDQTYPAETNWTVKKLMNSWDWQEVQGTTDMANGTIDTSGDGENCFEFTHGMESGDYNAEIELTTADGSQTNWFWFSIVGKDFWAWPDKGDYAPGEIVKVYSYVGDPSTKTGEQGINVTIEQVIKRTNWNSLGATITGPYGITDGSGNTEGNFTLPSDYTGEVEVKLRENSTNTTTSINFQVNGMDVNFYPDQWDYALNDNFTGTMYLYETDGTLLSGASIDAKLRKEGDWDNPFTILDVENETSDGVYKIEFNLSAANGFGLFGYELELIVNDGAGSIKEWFKLSSFQISTWTTGATSGNSEVSPGENVYANVEVKDLNNQYIEHANVTFVELRNLRNWQTVETNVSVNSTTTNGNGNADPLILLTAPSELSDYVAILNISTANAYELREAWFKVVPTTTSISFEEPENATNFDPRRRAVNSQFNITVNATGNITSMQACVDRAENLFNGKVYDYNQQYCENAVNGTAVIEYTTPDEAGDYNLVFNIQVTTPQGTSSSEKYEWLRVVDYEAEGGGAFELNVWTEQFSVWAGNNATARVEAWDYSTWRQIDLDEHNCTIAVDDFKNERTWSPANGGVLNYTVQNNTDPWGNAKIINFEVPQGLSPVEHSARVTLTCDGGSQSKRFWFRPSVYQVTTLMKTSVEKNKSVSLWVKATDGNGNPKNGATVILEEIVNDWGGRSVSSFNNNNGTTNAQGEVFMNFTTPQSFGEYAVKGRVEAGGETQEFEKRFSIKGIQLELSVEGGQEVDEGADVNILVKAFDPNGNPFTDQAEVNLNVFSFCDMDMGDMEDNMTEGDYQDEPIEMMTELQIDSLGVLNNLTVGGNNITLILNNIFKYNEQFDPDDMNIYNFTLIDENQEQAQFEMPKQDYRTAGDYEFQVTSTTNNGLPINVSVNYMGDMQSSGGGGGCDNYMESAQLQNGVAYFNLGNLSRGEYNAEANLWSSEQGDAWTMKDFVVRKYKTTLSTNGTEFNPGEVVQVDLTALNLTDAALSGANYSINLFPMQFKMDEFDTSYGNATGALNSTGQATEYFTIPSSASGGPAAVEVELNYSGNQDQTASLFMIHDPNVNVQTYAGNTQVGKGVYFEVNVTGSSDYAIGKIIKHLKKTGTAIPMNQFMSGGKDSGTEDEMSNPIFLNESINTTVQILARDAPGKYSAMLFLFYKNATSFYPDSMIDAVFIDYEVIGDTTAPETVTGTTVADEGIGKTLNVSWAKVSNFDVAKYKVYCKESADFTNATQATLIKSVSSSINSTLVSKSTWTDGNTVYCAVTSVDGDGNENKTFVNTDNDALSDSTAPLFNVTAPQDSTQVPLTFTVSGTVTDGNLDTILVSNSTHNITVTPTLTTFPEYSFSTELTLAEGDYTIGIYANDTGGRETLVTRDVTVNASLVSSFSSWNPTTPFITDFVGDALGAGIDYTDIVNVYKTAHDGKEFFGLEVNGELPSNDYPFVEVYMDTDDDDTTGVTGGWDYKITSFGPQAQFVPLYQATGNDYPNDWSYIGSVDQRTVGKKILWAFNKTLAGVSVSDYPFYIMAMNQTSDDADAVFHFARMTDTPSFDGDFVATDRFVTNDDSLLMNGSMDIHDVDIRKTGTDLQIRMKVDDMDDSVFGLLQCTNVKTRGTYYQTYGGKYNGAEYEVYIDSVEGGDGTNYTDSTGIFNGADYVYTLHLSDVVALGKQEYNNTIYWDTQGSSWKNVGFEYGFQTSASYAVNCDTDTVYLNIPLTEIGSPTTFNISFRGKQENLTAPNTLSGLIDYVPEQSDQLHISYPETVHNNSFVLDTTTDALTQDLDYGNVDIQIQDSTALLKPIGNSKFHAYSGDWSDMLTAPDSNSNWSTLTQINASTNLGTYFWVKTNEGAYARVNITDYATANGNYTVGISYDIEGIGTRYFRYGV